MFPRLPASAAQKRMSVELYLGWGCFALYPPSETRAPGLPKRKGGPCGAAKFREETSKKADSAVRDRIAALHNLGAESFVCK